MKAALFQLGTLCKDGAAALSAPASFPPND